MRGRVLRLWDVVCWAFISVSDYTTDWCSGVLMLYIYFLFTHLLMLLPSFRRSPAAPVLAARSLPARSTRLSLLTFSPLVWTGTTGQNRFIKRDDVKSPPHAAERKTLGQLQFEETCRRFVDGSLRSSCVSVKSLFLCLFYNSLYVKMFWENVKKKLQATISSWTEEA